MKIFDYMPSFAVISGGAFLAIKGNSLKAKATGVAFMTLGAVNAYSKYTCETTCNTCIDFVNELSDTTEVDSKGFWVHRVSFSNESGSLICKAVNDYSLTLCESFNYVKGLTKQVYSVWPPFSREVVYNKFCQTACACNSFFS